jgi:hypothetical protein
MPPPPPPRRAAGLAGALGPAELRAIDVCARELRAANIEPSMVGDLALDAAARVALAATGNAPAALTALLVCVDPERASGSALDAVRDVPEARLLLAFMLSDAYLALTHPEGARA